MTIFTYGIGLDRTPEDLYAALPPEVRKHPLRLAVIDIRRDQRSRNHAWDWDAFWGQLQHWCFPVCGPQLANAKTAPVGSWVPYKGEAEAKGALCLLPGLLIHSPESGDGGIVLVCQCRDLEVRYKRGPKRGQLKSQCHRVHVANALADEVERLTGERPEVKHLIPPEVEAEIERQEADRETTGEADGRPS